MRTSLLTSLAALGALLLLSPWALAQLPGGGDVPLPKVPAPKLDAPEAPKPPAIPDAPQPAADAPKPADPAVPAIDPNELPKPIAAPKPATEPARDAVNDATRDARDAVRDATGNVRDAIRDARDAARDIRDDVRGTVRDVREGRDSRVGARAHMDVSTFRGPDLGLWFTRSSNRLLITDIAASGPIARMGFRERDYILSVNGHQVTTEADFTRFLLADDIRNQRVRVVVWRDGREQVVLVEPSVLIQTDSSAQADPLEEYGLVLDDRYQDRIVVWRVIPRSPAFYAGIRAGDVITTFAGRRVAGPREFTTAIARTGPGNVSVQVYRNRQYRDLTWDLPQLRAGAEARGEVREALRPVLDGERDGALDRRDDRLERRDDRLDNRLDRIEGSNDLNPPRIEGGANAGANAAVEGNTTVNPPATRPGLFPRLRGR